ALAENVARPAQPINQRAAEYGETRPRRRVATPRVTRPYFSFSGVSGTMSGSRLVSTMSSKSMLAVLAMYSRSSITKTESLRVIQWRLLHFREETPRERRQTGPWAAGRPTARRDPARRRHRVRSPHGAQAPECRGMCPFLP